MHMARQHLYLSGADCMRVLGRTFWIVPLAGTAALLAYPVYRLRYWLGSKLENRSHLDAVPPVGSEIPRKCR